MLPLDTFVNSNFSLNQYIRPVFLIYVYFSYKELYWGGGILSQLYERVQLWFLGQKVSNSNIQRPQYNSTLIIIAKKVYNIKCNKPKNLVTWILFIRIRIQLRKKIIQSPTMVGVRIQRDEIRITGSYSGTYIRW